MTSKEVPIPVERIEKAILLIRGEKVSTTGKAGGLISPGRAALLATLKGYPPLGITLWMIGLLPCSE